MPGVGWVPHREPGPGHHHERAPQRPGGPPQSSAQDGHPYGSNDHHQRSAILDVQAARSGVHRVRSGRCAHHLGRRPNPDDHAPRHPSDRLAIQRTSADPNARLGRRSDAHRWDDPRLRHLRSRWCDEADPLPHRRLGPMTADRSDPSRFVPLPQSDRRATRCHSHGQNLTSANSRTNHDPIGCDDGGRIRASGEG